MDDGTIERGTTQGTPDACYRLSWLAYLRPFVSFLVVLAVAYVLGAVSVALTIGGAVLAVAVLVYQLLVVRSVMLRVDDAGVWVQSGVLPWNRGASGVRWRDVEDAGYKPGFIGWLLNSYTVSVAHRFTRRREIVLPCVRAGDDAVQRINWMHSDYLDSHAER